MNYDVIIIGAGPGGIFAAYELMQQKPTMRLLFSRQVMRSINATVPLMGINQKLCQL
mgnify:CR=1 FL=1